MKRRLCSIIMALVLCIGLLPASAQAEETKKPWETNPTGWTALADSHSGQQLNGGNYYLAGDVTISVRIQFAYNVTLDLNGHKLTVSGTLSTPYMISVDSNSSLTLQDSGTGGTIDGNGQVTGVSVSKSSTFIMNGGSIQNCKATLGDGGGGVCVDASSFFIMNGGSIQNCTTDNLPGGGVYVSGSFTMNGGSIQNCTANHGGGVTVEDNGSFTMTGGNIQGCTNTSFPYTSGALYNNGTMNANGGTIDGDVYNNMSSTGKITRTASDTDAGTYTAFNGTVKNYGTIENAAKLTVSFDSKGGSDVAQQEVLKGQKVNEPDAPTRTGYTFGGWYSNEACTTEYSFGTAVTDHMTLYAKWTPGSYNIIYHLNGGGNGTGAPTTHTYGTATTLVAPTKVGHTFGGWYTDANFTGGPVTALGATDYTADITLYAKWTVDEYKISYNLNGGTAGTGAPAKHTYGTETTLVAPTKVGHTFGGWYTDANFTGTPVTSLGATDYTADINLYAKWTVNQYTITFDTDGGSEIAPITQNYKTAITAPAAPTKAGHTFAGWDQEIPEKMPAENVTITARWTRNQYTVTFDSNGGSDVAAQTVYYGDTATEPKAPTRSSHRFDGWYLDGKKYDFATPVTGDVALTAKWTFLVDPDKLAKPEEKPAGNPFTDVSEADYFHDAVLWAVENNITGGTTATTFSPFASCTRAQAVTFLYRSAIAMGLDVSVGEDTNILSYNDAFDVPEYAIPAFQWACGMGIVTGNNGNLNPNSGCTRAQIVAFLWRFAKAAGMDVSVGEDTNILSYNDAFDVPEYAIPAFQWACGESVVTGNNGNLDPGVGCTRAQIVTFLWRLLAE